MSPSERASRATALAVAILAAVSSLSMLAARQARAQVVISQVHGGNGNAYRRDYVELFNRGAATVDLAVPSGLASGRASGREPALHVAVAPFGQVFSHRPALRQSTLQLLPEAHCVLHVSVPKQSVTQGWFDEQLVARRDLLEAQRSRGPL